MILLIDLGNTCLKWMFTETDPRSPQQRLVHAGRALTEVLQEAWGDAPRPDAVWVANVAGTAAGDILSQWLAQRWECPVHFAASQASAHGVTNAYAEPARLGVDRWLALLAARQQTRGPACVVDCGTALTIDVLGGDGRHQGGLIIPGLGLMRRALATDTSDIAQAMQGGSGGDITLLARNTQDAVNAGTFYALVAAIDRVVADLGQELGQGMTRFICGGDAPALLPLLAGTYRHEPDLVLQGLAKLAEG